MSDKKDLSALFKTKENLPNYLNFRIDEVCRHFEKKIESIKVIDDKRLQLLCLFALIESLAQEYSGYSRGMEGQKFTKFVSEFQNKWDFLEQIDPVTLYYDVYEHLDDDINLDFMIDGSVYRPMEVIESEMADKIIAYLELKMIPNIDTYKRRHTYVNLLYKLRSKLSHELSTPGSNIPLRFGESEPLPYYISVSRLYSMNGEIVQDSIWELVVPVEFIEQLLKECLKNYLKFCEESERDPFLNNKFERKFRLAWYD